MCLFVQRFLIEKLNLKFSIYILLEPTNWDDFDSKNEFKISVRYAGKHTNLGLLKIISTDNKSTTRSLPTQFIQLGKEYCSLGERIGYYEGIKNLFGNHYLSILKALNDVAFFPQISESFENLPDFKNSLIRFDDQEQLMRQARYIIDSYDLNNLYSFEYIYKPNYSNVIEPLNISFNFNDKPILPNRIYALIGENGVGKTQLVSKLPIDLANQVSDSGVCQHSCHPYLNQATKTSLALTRLDRRTGLRAVGSTGEQSLTALPFQRVGFTCFAITSTDSRLARISPSLSV